MKTKPKILSGRCSWRVLSGFGNLSHQISSGNMTWTCWDFFYDFSPQASIFVQSTAVCSATFRRDLLLQLFNPYHIPGNLRRHRSPSHRPARDCVFTLFCVLRDEHLSIDRPVCPFFAWPTAAAGFVCYAAVILLATAS